MVRDVSLATGVPSRIDDATGFPVHVTMRLRAGLPSLRNTAAVRELERTFAGVLGRDDFRVVHYSLQTTHAHLLVEAAAARSLARGMMAVGARIARAVNRVFGRRGPVLAERFHARRALAYVLLNARRHAARLFGAVRIDPASSGRWFDGWRSAPAETGAAHRVPVARARSWLLAVGWRRHGLIDPAEIPGPTRDSGKTVLGARASQPFLNEPISFGTEHVPARSATRRLHR